MASKVDRLPSLLIGWCAVGGTAVGTGLSIANIVELSKQWALGYTGTFGTGFAVAVTLIFFVAGGAVFGVAAGLLSAGAYSAIRRYASNWAVRAAAATLGATAVALTALLFFRPDSSAGFLSSVSAGPALSILIPAVVGPYLLVAMCTRRQRRQMEAAIPTL